MVSEDVADFVGVHSFLLLSVVQRDVPLDQLLTGHLLLLDVLRLVRVHYVQKGLLLRVTLKSELKLLSEFPSLFLYRILLDYCALARHSLEL